MGQKFPSYPLGIDLPQKTLTPKDPKTVSMLENGLSIMPILNLVLNCGSWAVK